jgi:hypothetical protein
MNNSRQVRLNRADATSLYITLFDKMKAGAVYHVPKVAANSVAPTNADFFNLTTTQLPAGIIGIYGGGAVTPSNGSIVMASLPGAVGTGSVNVTADAFGNAMNLVRITDASTNEAYELPDTHPTYPNRQVYGLLQAANGVTDGTAVGASSNCQISFVVFDESNVIQLVAINGTFEFDTNTFRDNLHVPQVIMHGAKQIDDALTGGNLDFVERSFTVTASIAVGETLNINTGATNGSGTTTVATVTDGGVAITNLNIQTSGALFESSPSLVALDNGIQMIKGQSPLVAPSEVVWVSTVTVSFYRVLDIGDRVTMRIPLKNNQ